MIQISVTDQQIEQAAATIADTYELAPELEGATPAVIKQAIEAHLDEMKDALEHKLARWLQDDIRPTDVLDYIDQLKQ